MTESNVQATMINKRRRTICAISLIVGCLTASQQVSSFGIPTSLQTRRTTSTANFSQCNAAFARTFSQQCSVLFSKPSEEEDAEEKSWDQEESLLVMNVSPLPNVSYDDSLSRISQYIRSFPFAAILPVQPLQQLPTDDGGLELRFLRKKTHIKPGVDGGIRFFVHRQEEDDKIEILVKRNSDGQSVPKMFAEKLVIQSFAKGMALGSDSGNDTDEASSTIKVPKTRIESPTTDMVQIQSVFHKWI